MIPGTTRDVVEGSINIGGIIGMIAQPTLLDKNFAITKVITHYDDNYLGCYGGICGFGATGGKITNCYVGDIEVDGRGATGGICGSVSQTLTSDNFSCTDCSYYSSEINKYCVKEGYDVNVTRVENKNDLPRIIDVVGDQFKELLSGSVALKWQ